MDVPIGRLSDSICSEVKCMTTICTVEDRIVFSSCLSVRLEEGEYNIEHHIYLHVNVCVEYVAL